MDNGFFVVPFCNQRGCSVVEVLCEKVRILIIVFLIVKSCGTCIIIGNVRKGRGHHDLLNLFWMDENRRCGIFLIEETVAFALLVAMNCIL